MILATLRLLPRRLHLILAALGLRMDRGDWLEDGRLLACAYPRREASLSALAGQGVTLLVNLHERPHAPERLAPHGLTSVHVPLRDFSTPTPEQLERTVQLIEDALSQEQRVAVHCGGGLGRTGTVLACYLVSRGETADAAIVRVRRLRPGAIETQGQVQAIHAFSARVQPPSPGGRIADPPTR